MLLAVLLMLPIQAMVFASEAEDDIVILSVDEYGPSTEAGTAAEDEARELDTTPEEEELDPEEDEELPEDEEEEDEEDDAAKDSLAAPVASSSELQAALDDGVDFIKLASGTELIYDAPLVVDINNWPSRKLAITSDEPMTITASQSRHFEIIGNGNDNDEFEVVFRNVTLDGTGTGGGIDITVSNANITIDGAVIENCYTTELGGGIYIKGDENNITISDSVIRNNRLAETATSSRSGGGVYATKAARIASSVSGGKLTLINTEVTGNNAGWDGTGGGIYVLGTSLELINCTVSGNVAKNAGGGIYVATNGSGNTERATLDIEDCIISDNRTTAPAEFVGNGGGLLVTRAITSIRGDTVISNNTSTRYGGGIYLVQSTGTYSNKAEIEGNVVISGNTAVYGGGIYTSCDSSSASATNLAIRGNVTLSGNTATSDGGAIYMDGSEGKYAPKSKYELVELRDGVVFADNQSQQGYYLVDKELIAIHGAQVDSNVTVTEPYQYLYNNHDIGYTDGETEPPAPAFRIIDEPTLRQAVSEAIASGESDVVFTICVPRIDLTQTLTMDFRTTGLETLNITFNKDASIEGDVLLNMPLDDYHTKFYPVGTTTLTFDGVDLVGSGTGGGVYIWNTSDKLVINDMTIRNVRSKRYSPSDIFYIYTSKVGTEIELNNVKMLDNEARQTSAQIMTHTGNGTTITFNGGEYSRNKGTPTYGFFYHSPPSGGTSGAPSTITLNDVLVANNGGTGTNYAAISVSNANLYLNGSTQIINNTGYYGAIRASKVASQTQALELHIGDDVVISGNRTTIYGGAGLAATRMLVTIDGNARITGNSAATNGGGIQIDDLANLQIRGNAVVADNTAGNGPRYLTDAADAALHAQQIDEDTVTWTEGFDYAYNNHDVLYTKGSTEPPAPGENYNFKIITEVFEYGQDVIAVAIDMGEEVDASTVNAADYTVSTTNLNPNNSAVVYEGPRTVTNAYVSNVENVGSPAEAGRYIILELEHGFQLGGASTLIYTGGRNLLLVMNYEVDKAGSNDDFTKTGEINLIVDDFAKGVKNELNYRLYSPDSDETLPLVIWMHGAGESGTNNESQIRANMGGTAWASPENQAERPAYVLAGQASSGWNATAFNNLYEVVQELIDAGKVDPDRVYISGCSMGGAGTWNFMLAYPEIFAAAVPICPANNPNASNIGTIKNIPTWIFHAANDRTVGVNGSRTVYNLLLESGRTDVHYTEFEGVVGIDGFEYPDGHWSWVPVLNNHVDDELGPVMDWLFAQVRQEIVEEKIVDEETLLAALEKGLAESSDVVLPIAVNEIELSAAISLTQEANITFTVDAEPVEEIEGDVVLTAANSRHITLGTDTVSLTFDGVALNGENTGGGIESRNGAALSVSGAVIYDCYASLYGGAIRTTGGSVTVTDSSFSGNSSGNGGAIHGTTRATLVIENSSFDGNTASSGGAVYAVSNSSVTVRDSQFTGNEATGRSGSAGALFVGNNTTGIVSGSTFIGNTVPNGTTAGGGGAIHATAYKSLAVTDCEFTDNSTAVFAGAIYVTGQATSRLTVTGSTFTGNSAVTGGAIAGVTVTPIAINNSTFTGNTASGNGGAISVDYLTTLTVRGNTVFSNNRSQQGYYMWDPADIALHEQQVDSTVTYSGDYEYLYNNDDVVYTKGQTEPIAPAEAISLSISALTSMRKNTTMQLEATVLPSNAVQQVTWSSSNENVLTIDENGLVTAHKVGSAIITCTTYDGSVVKMATIRVSA